MTWKSNSKGFKFVSFLDSKDLDAMKAASRQPQLFKE